MLSSSGFQSVAVTVSGLEQEQELQQEQELRSSAACESNKRKKKQPGKDERKPLGHERRELKEPPTFQSDGEPCCLARLDKG